MSLRTTIILLALLVPLAAGCGDDSDHLRVRGVANVELADGTRTGFDFPDATRLVDDSGAVGPDIMAGHCIIEQGAAGSGARLHIGVGRPNASDLGLRSLEVTIDEPGRPATGQVRAKVGEAEYVGVSGAECTIEEAYLLMDDRIGGALVDCTVVASGATETAHAIADLHFAGCELQ